MIFASAIKFAFTSPAFAFVPGMNEYGIIELVINFLSDQFNEFLKGI